MAARTSVSEDSAPKEGSRTSLMRRLSSSSKWFGGSSGVKTVTVKKKSADVMLGVTLRRPLNAATGVIEELVIAELAADGLLASTPLSVGDVLRTVDGKPVGGPELENEVNVATYLKRKTGSIVFGVVLGAKAEFVPLVRPAAPLTPHLSPTLTPRL